MPWNMMPWNATRDACRLSALSHRQPECLAWQTKSCGENPETEVGCRMGALRKWQFPDLRCHASRALGAKSQMELAGRYSTSRFSTTRHLGYAISMIKRKRIGESL